MQPQLHNLASRTGDAAGLEQSAASMTVAADAVPTATNTGTALAARAPPETEVAASRATATRTILITLKQYWRRLQERRQRQRMRIALYRLSERELKDIGLTRADIEYITAHRSLDRLKNSTTRLWMHSGT